jgi:hypothetical protein
MIEFTQEMNLKNHIDKHFKFCYEPGKVKFWSKIAIEAIRAKLFLQIISGYMNLKFKQNK